MYKNIVYFNKYKSIKRYEKKLLENCPFTNLLKTKNDKREIIYKTSEFLVTINKSTVNFLVYNNKKYMVIDKIEKMEKIL
ncbi:MAG: hypothetical protein IJE43_01590 [Alphaproteobacteria bacterium]|nr:hypothetical protein [Alphaproteobacteria bacterium]